MLQRIRVSLLADQRGLTTVEYVIVLCLIAALAVGTWSSLGTKIKGYAHDAGDAIDGKVAPALQDTEG